MNLQRLTAGLLLLGLLQLLVGCGRRNYQGEQRFALSGKVTYAGTPIDAGTISFLPEFPEKQRVSGGVIQDGAYNVPEARGANAGKYRIQIRWLKLTGKMVRDQAGDLIEERKEGLPAKFHEQSNMHVIVDANNTHFDFHLQPE